MKYLETKIWPPLLIGACGVAGLWNGYFFIAFILLIFIYMIVVFKNR